MERKKIIEPSLNDDLLASDLSKRSGQEGVASEWCQGGVVSESDQRGVVSKCGVLFHHTTQLIESLTTPGQIHARSNKPRI